MWRDRRNRSDDLCFSFLFFSLPFFPSLFSLSFSFSFPLFPSIHLTSLLNYYSLLSKVLVIHFLAGVATTILITKIAVTQQQQRLCNKE